MSGWNFADVFDVVAAAIPDSPALLHGARKLTWSEVDRRADALARFMASSGLQRQDKVTQHLHNSTDYIESILACFKGSFVPLNTNFRYGPDELVYLWLNGDVSCVIFHGSHGASIERAMERVPGVRLWLWVDDGTGACPDWATPYEAAVLEGAASPAVAWAPDGDDLFLLYTGGTTGMPKGVMWRQDDLFMRLNTERGDAFPEQPNPDFIRSQVSAKGRPHLSAGPLMHGAGLLTCFLILSRGGSISHLMRRSFDPVDLLDTIERDRVASLMWVGDAFARPVLAALDEAPGRWDLSSLRVIMSSGVVFSESVKQGILRHMPKVTITDVFGSSETMSLGRSVTAKGETTSTASFKAKPETRVVDEDGRDVVPGSGQRGLLAIGGRQPLGYYKDEAKTASAFRMIDGRRYVVAGDWATVSTDGVVTLLGRGSECINTGGEKVFPEEVEAVLKRHAAIYDAVVVGVPDERFGQSIVAVVEPQKGARVEAREVIDHVKTSLSSYKAPRHVIAVDQIGRGPNGKADLKAIREIALAHVSGR